MKIVKPAWVNHGGKPIFSIDVHPDGTRFATGGQGENSGKIVIWSMLPIQDEQKENDKSYPKQLCQMDNHLACVNCVRWSSNGRLLASGGDDKLVMIWRYTGGTSHSFGSDQENVETWRCSTTLRGHAGDVLDVAWAPHDVYLATCSVDNMVIVWNAQNFPEQVRMLKGHNSLVKGVAWDPIGKYLASQSDDRSLIVWRTRDWRQETVVTEPFAECGGTTHVLRPSWSPEGGMLVSAHAMNNAGPVAKIIERTANWKADMDFVGHRKAVTCVRFNPRVFCKKAVKGTSQKPLHYCCCAIGSRDTSFSVWLTNNGRPLMVMHDMFEKSIMDLAWNAAGTELLVCSTDGTVGYVHFAADELSGRALSDPEKTELLAKFYGQSAVPNGPAVASGSVAGGGSQIIESTAMLKLQQQQQQQLVTTAAAAAAAPAQSAAAAAQVATQPQAGTQDTTGSAEVVLTPGNSSRSIQQSGIVHPQVNLTKQLETRTPDGKRRITPIFLAPPPELGDIPLPVALPMFTTSTEQSKIIVEKTDGAASKSGAADDSAPAVTGATGAAASANESDGEGPPKLEPAPASPVFGTSIVSIQPMTIAEATGSANVRRASAGTSTPHVADERSIKHKRKELEQDAECGSGKAALKGASQRMTAKRRLYAAQQQQQQQKRRRLQQRLPDADAQVAPGGAGSSSGGACGAAAAQHHQQRADGRGEAPTISATADRSSENREPPARALVVLMPPQAQKCFTARAMGGTSAAFTVEVENDMHCSGRGGSGGSSALHCLRCQKQGQTVWEWISGSRVTLLAASRWGVALATADHAVTLLNTDGRPLCLPIALDGTVAVLQAAGKYCLAATCKGMLWLWDIKVMECIVDAVSMAGLAAAVVESAATATASASSAPQPGTVESLQLTEDGRVIAKMRDGSAYFYNVKMRSWLRLFAGTDTVRLFSDLQCMTARGGSASSGAMVPHGFFASLRSHAAGLSSRHHGPDAATAAAAAAGSIYNMSLAASTESATSVQRACTISHIEEQMAATLALGSATEYKHLLLSLIRFLAQHGLEQRLRVICDELLGPVYKRARSDPVDGEDSSKTILGMSKRELLREALPIIGGANLQLQRLYAEYQEIAELTTVMAADAAPAAL